MNSLLRYLAPTRTTRPNPGCVAEWRHAEGGPWQPMAAVSGPEEASSELAPHVGALAWGDLVRVLDLQGQVLGFLVLADGGLRRLPSPGANTLSGAMFDHQARAWAQASGQDWEKAWDGSGRADWMLHFADHVGAERRLLVLAACDCAETVLQYVPFGEERPRRAIETARRWARGQATLQEVSAASDAARDAAGVGTGAGASAAWAASRAAARATGAPAGAAAGAASRAAVATGAAAGARAAAQYLAEASRNAALNAAWGVADDDDEPGAVDPAAVTVASHAAQNTARDAALASLVPLVLRHLPLGQLALALVARSAT